MSKERVSAAFAARLSRLPIARHPALMFNPWVEGYRDYAFGGRAGPSVNIRNVFHELGHAAQFGVSAFRTRARSDGFHFKVPKKFIFDRYCDDAQSGQATERELQTFACQLHLMRASGLKVEDKGYAEYSGRLMRWMHDWYWIPGESEEDRSEWCAARVMEHYASSTAQEVLDRLEAWLDATRARLNRQRLKERAYAVVEPRFRPLLEPVTSQLRL